MTIASSKDLRWRDAQKEITRELKEVIIFGILAPSSVEKKMRNSRISVMGLQWVFPPLPAP